MVRFLLVLSAASFLFLSCSCGSGCCAPPVEALRFASYRYIPGVTEEEIEAIEALRTSRDTLVYGMNYSSEAFHGDDGNVRGFAALVSEYFTELFGIPFKPATFEWDALVAGLESGAISFSGELTPSDERLRAGYIMTDPIVMRHVVSFRCPLARPANDRPPRYAFLEGTTTVGDVLSALKMDVEPIFVGDYDAAYNLLKDGEVDAFFDENPAEGVFDKFCDIEAEVFLPIIYSPVALVTKDGELAPIISVVQKMLKAGGRRHLIALYNQGRREFARHRFVRSLTDDEREFVRAGSAVRVAAESDNYPICFYNKHERRFEGVFIDVLREIEELTDITFEIVNTPDATWPEVLKMLEDGEVAMLSELMVMESRVGNFLWSEIPMSRDYYALLSLSSSPYVEINDVMDMRVGLLTGTANEAQFLQWFPSHADHYPRGRRHGGRKAQLRQWFPNLANTTQYIGMTEAALALERGEVDLVMASQQHLLLMTNYMERPGFKVNILFDHSYDSRIGFNINEARLLSVIDKALAQTDLRRISARWKSQTYDYRAKIAQSRLPWLVGALAMFLCVIILLTVMYVKERTEEKRLAGLVRERTREVEEQKKKYEIMSLTDHLTGIPNRRHFTKNMDREWRLAIRHGAPISALIIDLDKFKRFNDTYGHQQGDQVLKQAVRIITRSLQRPGDFAARWGGEEFVVLLPDTDLSGAARVAETIRANFENTGVRLADGSMAELTASIGVTAQSPVQNSSIDKFISTADAALYKAKESRNTVVTREVAGC